MNYIALLIISIIALDWFLRIVRYARTGDGKYKHQHFVIMEELINGKTNKSLH